MKLPLRILVLSFFGAFFFNHCQAQEMEVVENTRVNEEITPIITGAQKLSLNNERIQDKNIALVVNPTSVVDEGHLVDVLLQQGILIKTIFAPEHGFRGTADAGEKVLDGMDGKTGLPIISLYGKHRKPTAEDLAGIDIVIFDIQDVGVRFYTYISTLHYVMEACAENEITLLVLDRPNPNGHLVDGPVLDLNFQSFVGMHPVPVLHGMTVGEYAHMINEEGWLANEQMCELEVITCDNYSHLSSYSLPVKPSPNLPTDRAIEMYPSICLFEGTVISEGRGTELPFQVFGAPQIPQKLSSYSFTPKSKEGAKYPKFENQICYGFNVSSNPNVFTEPNGVNLDYLIMMYNLYPDKENFFLKNGFFDKLAGGSSLREAIIAGKTSDQIKNTWQEDLEDFKGKRLGYLLYDDFE